VEIHETFLRSDEGTDQAADASSRYDLIEQEILVRVRRKWV
jgi:hypothetical protein